MHGNADPAMKSTVFTAGYIRNVTQNKQGMEGL
jgi:hypothetical protein